MEFDVDNPISQTLNQHKQEENLMKLKNLDVTDHAQQLIDVNYYLNLLTDLG